MAKKIKIFLGLTIMAVFLSSMASGQVKITIKLADKAFHDFSFNEAIDLYTYAHEKDPENVHVIRRLADCYRNIGKMVQRSCGNE